MSRCLTARYAESHVVEWDRRARRLFDQLLASTIERPGLPARTTPRLGRLYSEVGALPEACAGRRVAEVEAEVERLNGYVAMASRERLRQAYDYLRERLDCRLRGFEELETQVECVPFEKR